MKKLKDNWFKNGSLHTLIVNDIKVATINEMSWARFDILPVDMSLTLDIIQHETLEDAKKQVEDTFMKWMHKTTIDFLLL